jgi:hypothetical protein
VDDGFPVLTRCFRGHATPAGKTFCDSCGAALDRPPAANGDEVVPSPTRLRSLLRRKVSG